MIKKFIRFVVGVAFAGSVTGLGIASTAGASNSPATGAPSSPGATIRIGPALPNATRMSARPSGTASPQFGVLYCSGVHVTTTVTGRIATTECVELKSSTKLFITAVNVTGPTFKGHQHATGGTGYTHNTTARTYTTAHGWSYTLPGSFHNTKTYCNTLWKNNKTGSYHDMGSACT
jgi:hypothetical protein